MKKDFAKAYSSVDLARRDKCHPLTVRNWKGYIKIRIETARSRAAFKSWETKTPYSYRYIRWDDVKEIAEKQFWKRIIFR